jgi:hypothetical protein
MFSDIGAYLRNHLLNFQGPGIARKVVVFESDDWGSIRIPSRDAYSRLKKKGFDLDKNPYNRFDSLETEEDLQELFHVLSSFRDSKNNHPVITANFIVGNPDFDKIASNNFDEFIFETFTNTYKRSSSTQRSWDSIKEGMRKGLIKPQFHGREHINASYWLQLLKARDEVMIEAFRENVYCLDIVNERVKRDNLLASLDFDNEMSRTFVYNHLSEGLDIFESIFDFHSASFIAPCNVWDDGAEKILAQKGVKYIQSLRGQKIPSITSNSFETKVLVMGKLSTSGQIYLVRNAYFEPATLPTYDWTSNCLRKIEAAFFWNKPAIISTHRLNFMGSIFPENRDANLLKLKRLLQLILNKWPDVEFMSTDQLGDLYSKNVCVV